MPKLLILVAVDLIDKAGNTVAAKAHEIHDVDSRQAKALIKTGQADDHPLALAWHSGDRATYQRLLDEMDASVTSNSEAVPPAGNAAPVTPAPAPAAASVSASASAPNT